MAVRFSSVPVALCPPGRYLVFISVRGWVDLRTIVWLERLCQFKNPMISSGIGLATFRLVAYNHRFKAQTYYHKTVLQLRLTVYLINLKFGCCCVTVR
jgi:hypothetical protein